MLAAPGMNAFGISDRGRPSSNSQSPLQCATHERNKSPQLIQPIFGRIDQASGMTPSSTRHGFLMECAANPRPQDVFQAEDTENKESERISHSVLSSLEVSPAPVGTKPRAESREPVSVGPSCYATYPFKTSSARPFVPLTDLSPPLMDSRPSVLPSAIGAPGPPSGTIPQESGAPPIAVTILPTSSPQAMSKPVSTPQLGHTEELDFRAMCEHIWRYNDQRSSLYLQERLRCCIPGEYEQLVAAIFDNVMPLMVHRFGNFLVQCMLQLAKPQEIAAFANLLEGHIAELAKDQFCCHVIQRLLDVGSVVIQATIAAELLEDIIDTMCSDAGSHVWQKLLHLPWKYDMPRITVHANNAVHLPPNRHGWLTIARTEAGCATIKSFLGVSSAGPERQVCLGELVDALSSLIVDPVGSVLAARIVMIAASRARALAVIFTNAYEYSKHPIASGVLITLLHFKIPSFPLRLSSAIAPYRAELYNSHYGKQVVLALDHVQSRN